MGLDPNHGPGPGPGGGATFGGRLLEGGGARRSAAPREDLIRALLDTAKSYGVSEVTPELLQARTTQPLRIRERYYTTSNVAGAGWVTETFDRSVILWPLSVTQGSMLFCPGGPPKSEAEVLRGRGPGVCHISHPGPWSVKYHGPDGGGAALRGRFLVIDSTDPVLASALLAEPGAMAEDFNPRVAIPMGVSTTILGPRRERTYACVQNVGGENVNIVIGAGPASAVLGFVLEPGDAWSWHGSSLHRKQILGWCSAAAGTTVQPEERT